MYRQGRVHLLVQSVIYPHGAVVRKQDLDAAIVKYADQMGVPKNRIHFLDRKQKEAPPGPLKTGDIIQRDFGPKEVDPPEIGKTN